MSSLRLLLPRRLRSREERQSDSAVGRGSHPRSQHHGASRARAVRRAKTHLQRRAAGTVDRKRRHQRRSRDLARDRRRDRSRASPQLVHHNENVALGDGGRTAVSPACPHWPRATPITGARRQTMAPTAVRIPSASSFVVVPPIDDRRADCGRRRAASSTTNQPDFRVTNGAISGTTGVGYRFEVSRTADFTQIARHRHRRRSTAAARRP